MQNIGVAVIGCGARGKKHASVWNERNDCAVKTVFDTDQDRAASLAKDTGASACPDWQAAVTDPSVQAVSICTPVCFHPEVAVAATQSGKHIFCEKPIALGLEEAKRMDQSAREAGVTLGISYQYRGRARYRKYRELVQNGTMRGPIMARFVDVREVRPKTAMHQRSMNGGPVIDMAGHYIDLMRFITGKEPQLVFASGHVFGKGKERLACIDDHAIDAAEIQVRYGGGHIASILVHWGLQEETKPFTQESIVSADLTLQPADSSHLELCSGKETETIALESPGEELALCLAPLVDAIKGEPYAGVTAGDGIAALSVSLAALESIETGKAVVLSAPSQIT